MIFCFCAFLFPPKDELYLIIDMKKAWELCLYLHLRSSLPLLQISKPTPNGASVELLILVITLKIAKFSDARIKANAFSNMSLFFSALSALYFVISKFSFLFYIERQRYKKVEYKPDFFEKNLHNS